MEGCFLRNCEGALVENNTGENLQIFFTTSPLTGLKLYNPPLLLYCIISEGYDLSILNTLNTK